MNSEIIHSELRIASEPKRLAVTVPATSAGLKRSLISGSLRDGAKKNMELIKEKLETDYRKVRDVLGSCLCIVPKGGSRGPALNEPCDIQRKSGLLAQLQVFDRLLP